MSKLFKDIEKMKYYIDVVEQYNNFKQLGIEEDIQYLKKRVDELYTIKDSAILIESFMWCSKILNLYYDVVDYEFKKKIIQN